MERGAGGGTGTARTATNKIPASPALGPPTEAERNPSSLPPPFCSIISARVMAGVDAGVDEEEGAPKIGSRWARTISSLAYLWDHERWENTPSRFPMAQNTVASEVGDCSCPLSSCTCNAHSSTSTQAGTQQKTKTKNDDDAEAGKEDDDAPANGEGGQGRGRASPKTGTETLLLAECAREAHLWTHTGVTESIGPAKMVCARPCFFGVVVRVKM